MIRFAICFLLTFVAYNFAEIAHGQFSRGDIVISELFNDMFLLDAETGELTDIYDPTDIGFLSNVVVREGQIYGNFGSDIYTINTDANTMSHYYSASTGIREFVLDGNGDFVAIGTNSVFRIDNSTLQESTIYQDTFFSPSDVSLGPNGEIYVVEFFESLGLITQGNYDTIGDFDANQFDNIAVAEDGFLYTLDTFTSEILRIDPTNGFAEQLLGTGEFSASDEIEFGLDGSLLISAAVGGEDTIFRLNESTGELETLFKPIGGAFSPLDFTVVRSIPEPSVAIPIFLTALAAGAFRRRR